MLNIDHYAYTNGLKDVHPIEKVSFTFIYLFFSIITKNIWITGLTFIIMTLSVVLAAKIPFRQFVKLLLLPSLFLLTSIISILFSIAPIDTNNLEPLWKLEIGVWQFYISSRSANQAIHLFATVLASISSLYFLILTTPLHQLMWVLQKVKLPTLFIELVGLTYRFIFVLFDKMSEIHLAQSSRLGYQNYKTWFSSIAQLTVSLFIKSIQSSRELQYSIDSRGGDDGLYEVDMRLKYNRLNIVAIVVSMVVLFIIMIFT
ncbi:cobalt ECF transporter T component CbiQ [Bacillus marasmi]|uniref:cobalt ECF transporter T component CbiQ n=1 Tax=Bacillus marasmi TaxID=1926279 RepID=UPI0011CB103B|nr:cobalt ECF transporter T component CbiQ [Bacillus marasmi]